MPRRPPKRSLVEALSETQALHASRDVAARRVSRAKREALAARPPNEAIMRYQSAMSSYAGRVEAMVERHVLSRLPVLGSGDLLDPAAIESGLSILQADLDLLALKMRRSAIAAGNRISAQARGEVSRMMRLKVDRDVRARIAVEVFAQNAINRLRYAGTRQITQIRQAIEAHQEGESMRQKILHSLWVSRNGGAFIARDSAFRFSRETVAEWSLRTGSTHGVYHTRHDELVRPHHAEHDGKVYSWSNLPSTLQEPNCRCRVIPVEATY